MNRPDPSFLVVGHVNKAHGTKGDLFVWCLTDHPEVSFRPGVVLYVADEAGTEPDSAFPSYSIRSARPFRRGFLVGLEGVEGRDDAEGLHGRYLLRPLEELAELDEGEFFYHQLVGLTVETPDGDVVGEVVEVYELRPADLLEVRGASGTRFIPFVSSLVTEIDLDGGRLRIDPPPGLLDL